MLSLRKHKKSLEITCYVVGAGAFGVFFRWLQVMLAFDESGLSEKSAFNVLVPAVILAAAWMFGRFIKQFEKKKLIVPEEFCEALFNPGKLFTAVRWILGMLMSLGGVVIIATTETDKNVEMLRVLALFAILSGVSFPLLLDEANYEKVEHQFLIRLYSVMPIILFSFWLVVCYKENAYNSVAWSYVMEMAAIIAAIIGFFRMAGFAYGVVDSRKCYMAIMLGAQMCIMTLADERNIGEQLVFLAAGLMLAMYNWILIFNMRKKKADPNEEEIPQDDGFEYLG